jgi:serine/threonine protein kinase
MTASTRSSGVHSAIEPPPPRHVELPPGTRLGRYVVGEEIGRGSYAVVYHGTDTALDREVALKTMPRSARDLLLHEARLLCRIGHRHVVRLDDVVSGEGIEALVLELVTGSSLTAVVRRGPLDCGDVAVLGAQLAAGLAALHAADVIHRDIKPANLRLTAGGDLKILDLGIGCRLTSDRLPDTCAQAPAAGTIPYMAPERLQGNCGDTRSDLWSAGAVMFELLTGSRAQDRLSATARERYVRDGLVPEPWRLTSSLLPSPLAAIVARLLEPDPDRRYQSAQELEDALSRGTLALVPPLAHLSMAGAAW